MQQKGQYSDLPQGAQVVGYSDLPEGAQLVSGMESVAGATPGTQTPEQVAGIKHTDLQKVEPEIKAHNLEHTPYVPIHSARDVGKNLLIGASNFGAGTLQAPYAVGSMLLAPKETASSIFHDPANIDPTGVVPLARAVSQGKGAEVLGNLVGGAVLGEAGRTAGEVLPSKGRAVNTLTEIENQAKDVPLSLTKTQPALAQFDKYTQSGGMNSPVVRKLSSRLTERQPRVSQLGRMEKELAGDTVEPTPPEPLKFPEARDFYTHVSRASSKPGFLRRAIENPERPQQRMELGNIREGLNSDLTDAADQVGRGKDYQDALTEYGRAAKLNRMVRRGLIGAGAYAGEEALRKMGLLGIASKMPGGF